MSRTVSSFLRSVPLLALGIGCLNGQGSVGDTTVVHEIDEVVVTGTRAPRRIIDIPYSVVRIDQGQYRFDKKVSVNDVLGNVPGLFLQSRYGNHDVRISIRGFGSRSNSGIRGVRILLDDIPESEPDGQTRIEAIDFNAIGRTEIAKGNSSSLYTNAPGGVVNFISDLDFLTSSVVSFNDFSSFGLRRNGFKVGVRTPEYGLMSTYTYHTFAGFRQHSEDFWHIWNMALETTPSERTRLQILGYYVDGLIRLPGSLTRKEFAADPHQPASRERDLDFRRITRKGRVGVRFSSQLDEEKKNEIEITSYGTIKYFERTDRRYRIITRYGLGSSAKYINRTTLGERDNEFTVGTDLFYQAGPVELYDNIGGLRGDEAKEISDDIIANVGVFFQNSFELYGKQLYLMISGRYDKVVFSADKRAPAPSFSDTRRFEEFTPKAALNYKVVPNVSIYTSYGLSFDTPAGNELSNYPFSSNPSQNLNPDLKPQKSKNFELGVKGRVSRRGEWFDEIGFEATFFNSIITDEIVPFEVFGDVFFRNSARTKRKGIEFGTDLDVYTGVKLKLSYTYSRFTYDDYTARTISLDSTGNLLVRERTFSGNTVPSIPEHNINVSLGVQQQLSTSLVGFARVHYQHVEALFVDDANSEKAAGYNLLGSTLGADIMLGRFNILVSAGINNMFDVTYVGFVNINSTSRRFYEAGEPRNVFGNIRFGYAFE